MLDEAVRRFLAVKPDAGSDDDPIEARRQLILAASDALFAEFGEPGPAVAAVEEHAVVHQGRSTRLRVYRPDDTGDHPVHVFLHGGGWWLGSVDEHVVDATCRERAIGAQCTVVSVEYSLAPEAAFPAAVEDCYAALVWASQNAAMIGGDPHEMSIGGVSAGANLAASVALLARDRGGPALRLQLLEVPPLDLTLDTMRASGVGDGFGITVAEMETCTDLYLRLPAEAHTAAASPLLAADVGRLPHTAIHTAEFDPLRADGAYYAGRLMVAGVSVSHVQHPGGVHGSLALTAAWPPARAWQDAVIADLRRAHRRPAAAAVACGPTTLR